MGRAFSVIDRATTSPPGSPSLGDAYVVGAGATGAWSGLDGSLAAWHGEWVYSTILEGDSVWDRATNEDLIHNGSALAVRTDATGVVLKSGADAKGDILAATADNAITRMAVGADGTVLQAFAGATPGLRYAGAPLSIAYARTAIGSGVDLSMAYGVTDGDFVLPVGWILKCVAASAHSPLTTANTLTFTLRVDDVDVSASWTTLALAASTTDATDSAEPNSPPYTVDATSAAKRVGFRVASSASGGGNAVAAATLCGYLYKAT